MSDLTLTVEEEGLLATHEATIERHRQSFQPAAQALLAIRESRLYRRHGTFEDYCRDRWGWGRSYVNMQIRAVGVLEDLGTAVPKPSSERQVRELAPLRGTPQVMRQVWDEAVERAGGQPTAPVIREVREEIVKFNHIEAPVNLGPDKTRAGVDARHERIRAMAQQGYRTEAIAAAVGVGEQVVNRVIREAGITPIHDVIGKTRRVDVNRVMEGVVDAVLPSEHALAAINADWNELDRERFADWTTSLRQSFNAIRRLLNRLEGELK